MGHQIFISVVVIAGSVLAQFHQLRINFFRMHTQGLLESLSTPFAFLNILQGFALGIVSQWQRQQDSFRIEVYGPLGWGLGADALVFQKGAVKTGATVDAGSFFLTQKALKTSILIHQTEEIQAFVAKVDIGEAFVIFAGVERGCFGGTTFGDRCRDPGLELSGTDGEPGNAVGADAGLITVHFLVEGLRPFVTGGAGKDVRQNQNVEHFFHHK